MPLETIFSVYSRPKCIADQLTIIGTDFWLQVSDLLFKSNDIWMWHLLGSKNNSARKEFQNNKLLSLWKESGY